MASDRDPSLATERPVDLSIVIPAYNEEERLGDTLLRVRAWLDTRPRARAEIIVVDDGCTDGTCDVAAAALEGMPGGRLVRRVRNRGKGYSVREGILASRGRLILFTDADLSTPIEEYPKLQARIQAGDDIVIGSRALRGADIRERQGRLRESLGKAFNVLVRLFVMRGIPDTQCGFKLLRREAALDVFSRVRTCGFAFDVEALYVARRLGYRIGQVPVVWTNSAESKVRMVRSSAAMIRDLLRIRRRHRGLRPAEDPRNSAA